MKALAKEQKRALRKAAAAGGTSTETPGNPHGAIPQGNPHGAIPQGNPHGVIPQGNPHGAIPQGNPHGAIPQGNPHGVIPQENPHGVTSQGNPHGDQGNPHREAQHDTLNPHGEVDRRNPFGEGHYSTGNPNVGVYHDTGNPPMPSLDTHLAPDSSRNAFADPDDIHPRDTRDLRNPHELMDSHDFGPHRDEHINNPRVRELRDRHNLSGSKSPTRQSDDRSREEQSYRGDYHDYGGGGFSPRHNPDESYRRGDMSHESYHDHSPRRACDDRYERDQREIERPQDRYDYPRRGRSRRDDYEYYETRRSREDLSYLDRSYDSSRLERSSREELESYNLRDRRRDSSSERGGGFKPIHDNYDYRDPYRSHTPSSGSGRSSPTGYGYHDHRYYGQYQYPGYHQQQYGYYPGHYGMQPYYYYPPDTTYPYYDYYHQYGAYGSGHGSAYSNGDGSYPADNQQSQDQTGGPALAKDQQG